MTSPSPTHDLGSGCLGFTGFVQEIHFGEPEKGNLRSHVKYDMSNSHMHDHTVVPSYMYMHDSCMHICI